MTSKPVIILLISLIAPAIVCAQTGDGPKPGDWKTYARFIEVNQLNLSAFPASQTKVEYELFGIYGEAPSRGSVDFVWRGSRTLELTIHPASPQLARDGANSTGPKAGVREHFLVEQMLRSLVGPLQMAVKQEGFHLSALNMDSAPAGAACYKVTNEEQPFPAGWPFCVNEEQDVTNDFGDGRSEVRRGAFKSYNGRHIPTAIEVRYNGRLAIRGQVRSIEPLTPGQNEDYPEPPARATQIPADVMAGRIVDKPQPKYPGVARIKHITGSVTVEAIIDKQGSIRNLEVIASPDPELTKASVAAVQRWRYTPYSINGEATEVDTTIRVNFDMK